MAVIVRVELILEFQEKIGIGRPRRPKNQSVCTWEFMTALCIKVLTCTAYRKQSWQRRGNWVEEEGNSTQSAWMMMTRLKKSYDFRNSNHEFNRFEMHNLEGAHIFLETCQELISGGGSKMPMKSCNSNLKWPPKGIIKLVEKWI